VLLSKQSLLWFHQSQLSLFRPFVFSSKLDHTTCPDLLLVIEARRYERTSFSLLKDRSELAIHTAIISIICKAIRRMSGGLQNAEIFKVVRIETSILQSRIFPSTCLPSTSQLYTAPKLSHVDFSFSQSGLFYKALDIEKKAKLEQKKLALNITNKSLSWVKVCAHLERQRYC